MIQTISLKYDQTHKVLGILSQFILTDAACSIYSLNIGIPQPWRNKASKNVKTQQIFLKSIHLATDEKPSLFSWECFCFDGEERDITESQFFAMIPFNSVQLRAISKGSSVSGDEAIVNFQSESNNFQSLVFTSFNQFFSNFSNFFTEICPVKTDIYSLVYRRFSLQNSLLRHRNLFFANEIFVDFDQVEERVDTYLARKNLIFPSKFLNSTVEDARNRFDKNAKIGCFIGSFSSQSVIQIALGTVNYQGCFIKSTNDGEIQNIQYAKGLQPYKNGERKLCQIMVVIFIYCCFDSQSSLSQSQVNCQKARNCDFLMRHFTYLSQAFSGNVTQEPQQKQDKSNCKLQLFRPVFCSLYGGLRFCVKNSKKDVCITFPSFKRIKLPEIRFPVHLSQSVAQAQFSVNWFVKQRGIVSEKNKIWQISIQQLKVFSSVQLDFFVENFTFQTHKNQERLVNSFEIMQVLPYQLLCLMCNKELNLLSKQQITQKSTFLTDLEPHKSISSYSVTESEFLQQNFSDFLDLNIKTHFGQTNACVNFYQLIMKSFIRKIDQNDPENKILIQNLKIQLLRVQSQNFFQMNAKNSSNIIKNLEQIGIFGITEDFQELDIVGE
eukprot:EST45818.1 hypothetical protein SS50377_14393 [Spironucleus salmonicida]